MTIFPDKNGYMQANGYAANIGDRYAQVVIEVTPSVPIYIESILAQGVFEQVNVREYNYATAGIAPTDLYPLLPNFDKVNYLFGQVSTGANYVFPAGTPFLEVGMLLNAGVPYVFRALTFHAALVAGDWLQVYLTVKYSKLS